MSSPSSESYQLWLKGLRPKTARAYGIALKRLFEMAKMTPDEAVSSVMNAPNGFNPQAYMRLTQLWAYATAGTGLR